MLRVASGMQAILDLEDRAPGVLFETVPGSSVPLWPQIRNGFAVLLGRLDFPAEPVTAAVESRASAWRGLLDAFLPSRWDASSARGRSSLCCIVGGNTVYRAEGRERNWLVGDFAESRHGNAAILQWRGLPGRNGDPSLARTWTLDRAETRAAGFARLSRRDPDALVRAIVTECARQLDLSLTDDMLEPLVTSAIYQERLRPFVDRAVARVVDRLAPSVVLMEDASYGGRASIVALLRERGILVAEPQHGWIGPTHPAYSFGAAMHTPELRRTLPDELLTFGEYWSEGLRHPATLTPIGKPHLEAVSQSAPPVADRPNELLIVSSTADPAEMSGFVLELREALDETWDVRFRPHPGERTVLHERYGRLVSAAGVLIDERPDVYASLATARVVIGVASTVLFEARAFGCAVLARDSAFVDYYIGDLFGEPLQSGPGAGRSAAARVREVSGHIDVAPIDRRIWADNAMQQFQSWLDARL